MTQPTNRARDWFNSPTAPTNQNQIEQPSQSARDWFNSDQPQGAVNFGQPKPEQPSVLQQVGQGVLDVGGSVLGALGWVLQPLAAPQQILYGAFLDLKDAVAGNGLSAKNLGRGLVSAGSYLTYGAFDNAQTRADNNITGSEILRRFNVQGSAAFWGGLAIDIFSDPANLLAGAGAARKTAAFGKIKAIEETGEIAAKVAKVADLDYKLGGLAKSAEFLKTQGVNPNNAYAMAIQATQAQKTGLLDDIKILQNALEKQRASYKVGERLVRLGDYGGLTPVGVALKQVGNLAIAPVQTIKLALRGRAGTAVDEILAATKTQIARVAATELQDVRGIGRFAADVVEKRLGKQGVTVGEFFLPQRDAAEIATARALPSVGAEMSEGAALLRLKQVEAASRAAQTKLNQLGTVVSVTAQKVLNQFKPQDRKAANDAMVALMSSTSVGAYNGALEAISGIAAKTANPVKTQQLMYDAYKAQVRFDMYGGTLLQGIQKGQVEKSLAPRQYELIAKELRDAPPEQLVRVATNIAKRLDREYGAAYFGIEPTGFNARGIEVDAKDSIVAIRDALIGETVGGRVLTDAELSARQTPLTGSLVRVLGEDFARQAKNQIDAQPDVLSKISEAQKIADDAFARVAATGVKPEDVFRVDSIDELYDGIEIMPSAIRRSFLLYGEYGEKYLEKVRSLNRPSELVLNPERVQKALTRMQSTDYPKLFTDRKVNSLPQNLNVTQIAQDLADFTQTGDFQRAVDRAAVSGVRGEPLNLVAAMTAIKAKHNLNDRQVKAIIDEFMVDAGVISSNKRSSERLVSQLRFEISEDGRTGGALAGVKERQDLSAQVMDDLGEIREAHRLLREQEKVVGRVAAQRAVRLQMGKMVEETLGARYNIKQNDIASLPAEIREMLDAQELVALNKPDSYGVFKEGDVIPKLFERQLRLTEVTKGNGGAGGELHTLNLFRSWFTATKLATPASIVRNVFGSFQMADQLGISAGELTRGIVDYFADRAKNGENFKQFIESGVSGNTYTQTELDIFANLEVRKVLGIPDKVGDLILKYIGEQKGTAPQALSDKPLLQKFAKIGGAEILAGAAIGTAVAPIAGTIAGAAAGATLGGSLGLSRKLFQLFGATEQVMRGAIFYAAKKRGLETAEAADLAEAALYNYAARPVIAELAERTFAVPFATFAAYSTVNGIKALYERPARVARLVEIPQQAANNQTGEEQSTKAMPDWLKKSMPIPLPIKDSEGRNYYLPMKALVSVGGLEDLLQQVTDGGVNAATENPLAQSPLLSLYKTVVLGQGFAGRKVYEPVSGENLSDAVKNNPSEAARLAIIEVLNFAGYPIQAGSPFAQRVAKAMIPMLETDETIAKRFGIKAEEARQQVVRWSSAALTNGIAIWGEGQYANKMRPTQTPPREPISVLSQFVGLPLIPVQGDPNKLGDARNKILGGERRIQELEQEYTRKAQSLTDEAARQQLADTYTKLIQEEQKRLAADK